MPAEQDSPSGATSSVIQASHGDGKRAIPCGLVHPIKKSVPGIKDGPAKWRKRNGAGAYINSRRGSRLRL